MGNIALAAANLNYYTGMLHDAQGQLAEVGERRSLIALIISQSEDSTNPEAEAEDRSLEQIEQQLQTQVKMLEALQKAASKLVESSAKDMAPKFQATT